MAANEEKEARIAGELEKVSAISSEISLNVNQALQSLQFEDLTTQLLHQSQHRINSLPQVMAGLSAAIQQLARQLGSDVDSQAALVELENAVEHALIHINSLSRNVVEQSSMDDGDIELF